METIETVSHSPGEVPEGPGGTGGDRLVLGLRQTL